MRLFFALWPDAFTQQSWFSELAPFLAPLGGRRVPAANLHLTLAFYGDVSEHRLDDLAEALVAAAARRTPIACRVAGGGACRTCASAGVAAVRCPVGGR